jgi:hypothetical protein
VKVKAIQSYGFIGFQGQAIRLSEGDEFEHDDPFVLANPEKFAEAEQPKRRGRRSAE